MDSQLQIFTCSAIMLCKYFFTPAGQMLGLVSRRHWRTMGGGRGFPFWFSCAYLPGLLQRARFLLVLPGGQQAHSSLPGRFPHHTRSQMASEWRAAGKAPSCERFLWIFCSEFWDRAPEISRPVDSFLTHSTARISNKSHWGHASVSFYVQQWATVMSSPTRSRPQPRGGCGGEVGVRSSSLATQFQCWEQWLLPSSMFLCGRSSLCLLLTNFTSLQFHQQCSITNVLHSNCSVVSVTCLYPDWNTPSFSLSATRN